MKPRSKQEREVVELSKTLPPLADIDYNRLDSINDDNNYYVPSEMMDEKSYNESYGVRSRYRAVTKKTYYSIVTTCRKYQVIRTFLNEYRLTSPNATPRIRQREVMQRWISEDGKQTIIAASFRAFSYGDCDWSWDSQMSIKDSKNLSYVRKFAYENEAENANTRLIKLSPQAKRNGLTLDLIKKYDLFIGNSVMLAFDPRGEYLLKHGHVDMFKMVANRRKNNDRILKYIDIIKICDRHHYVIPDVDMWLDMLDMMEHLGADIHQPKFVCAADLKAEHDKWTDKYNRKLEKEQREKRIREAAANEEQYYKSHMAYFGIAFGSDISNLKFHVISSALEMIEEGASMHHCVAGYVTKDESLILSCRRSDGSRLATIEVNLKTFEVVQIRGIQNKVPEHYEEIKSCMENNLHMIKQAKNTRRIAA